MPAPQALGTTLCAFPRPLPSEGPAELCNPWARQDAAIWQHHAQEWAKLPLMCPEPRGPANGKAQPGSRICCMLGARAVLLCRSYCRDLTMALRAWGVSETEEDEL